MKGLATSGYENASDLLESYCSAQGFAVLGAVCDEASEHWDDLRLPKALEPIGKPDYRNGLAFIYDVASGRLESVSSKEAVVRMEIGGIKFESKSRGFMSQNDKGEALFAVDQNHYSLKGSRGLSILAYDVLSAKAVDFFSLDLFADSSLRIHREHDSFGVYPDERRRSFEKDRSACIQHLRRNDYQFVIERARSMSPYDFDSEGMLVELLQRSDDSSDREEAFRRLEDMVPSRPDLACSKLSLMLFRGIGAKADPPMARRLFRQAALYAATKLPLLTRANPRIAEFEKVYVRGTPEEIDRIVAMCVQHMVVIDG